MCSKHVQAWNKLIIKFGASSWLILRNKFSHSQHRGFENRNVATTRSLYTRCPQIVCEMHRYYWITTAWRDICRFSVKLLKPLAHRLTSAKQPPAAVLHTSLPSRSSAIFQIFRSLKAGEVPNESESYLTQITQRSLQEVETYLFILLRNNLI